MSRVFTGNAANYLAPASNAAYNLGAAHAISFATWIKRNSTGSGHTMLGKTDTSYYFLISSGDKADAEGSTSKVGATSITNDGLWHHVAFTSDAAGNWVWYLDGVSDASGSAYSAAGNTTNLITLGQVAGILPLDGKLAYLALWGTQLTSGNVTTLQTSTTPELVGSGCIGSWHMSTNDGSSVVDSSATANDATVTGTVAFDSDNPSIGGGSSSHGKLLLLGAG